MSKYNIEIVLYDGDDIEIQKEMGDSDLQIVDDALFDLSGILFKNYYINEISAHSKSEDKNVTKSDTATT